MDHDNPSTRESTVSQTAKMVSGPPGHDRGLQAHEEEASRGLRGAHQQHELGVVAADDSLTPQGNTTAVADSQEVRPAPEELEAAAEVGVDGKNGAMSNPDEPAPLTRHIDFVTLGMFIIDDIDFLPPTPPVKDILGGAGSFSALGARLFSPPPASSTVGWIIDRGSDFPESLTALIDSWQTSVEYRDDSTRLTTRGWNGYEGPTQKRAFKYTTTKKRLTAEDLTAPLLQARAIHLICSPLRCQELVTDIIARRKEAAPDTYSRPVFIWEPVPDLCTPDELLNCTNTLPIVDICSPNHSELAGFMGDDGLDPETGEISTLAVERSCEQLLASMPLQSFSLVVRVGEKGCYIAKNGGRKRQRGKDSGTTRKKKHHARGGLQLDTDMEALFAGLLQEADGSIAREEIEVDPGIERWIPAYHQDSSKVVDPTGGGNTFLGGLGVALARGYTIEEAAVWGSVAASFAIEQVGMPVLEKHMDVETWNGHVVDDRLRDMQTRL